MSEPKEVFSWPAAGSVMPRAHVAAMPPRPAERAVEQEGGHWGEPAGAGGDGAAQGGVATATGQVSGEFTSATQGEGEAGSGVTDGFDAGTETTRSDDDATAAADDAEAGTDPGDTSPADEAGTEQGTVPEEGGDQAGSERGTTGEDEQKEPVVEVPEDAQRVDEDTTIEEGRVGVAPDGSVVDTRGDKTQIDLDTGERIVVEKDGSVVIDGPGRGESDRSQIRGNVTVETEDGTKIVTSRQGVEVTTKDGEKYRVNPDGSVEVDLPDEQGENGEQPGENGEQPGENGEENAEGEEPGAGDPSGGNSGGGNPGGGNPGGGDPGRDIGPPETQEPGDTEEPGDTQEPGDTEEPGDPEEPGDGETHVDTELMRTHARAWGEHAGDMKKIESDIDGLGLGAVDFGPANALHGGYEALRGEAKRLATDGAKAFETYERLLNDSARDYDDNEQRNVAVGQGLI